MVAQDINEKPNREMTERLTLPLKYSESSQRLEKECVYHMLWGKITLEKEVQFFKFFLNLPHHS